MESPLRAHARSLIANSISRLEARVHRRSAQQGGPGDHCNAHYPHLTGQTPSGPDADSCITEFTTPDVRAVLVYELLPADYTRIQGLPYQIIRIAACDPSQPYRLHVLARDILTGQRVEAVYFEDHEIPGCMSLPIPSEAVIDMFVCALAGNSYALIHGHGYLVTEIKGLGDDLDRPVRIKGLNLVDGNALDRYR